MNVTIELEERDIRHAVYEYLVKEGYPAKVLQLFGSNAFEVKMTYGEKEKFRSPRYMRFVVRKVLP